MSELVEKCLDIKCSECEWHILKNGKIDCNVEDRLGIGKPKITSYLEEEEKVEEEKT